MLLQKCQSSTWQLVLGDSFLRVETSLSFRNGRRRSRDDSGSLWSNLNVGVRVGGMAESEAQMSQGVFFSPLVN